LFFYLYYFIIGFTIKDPFVRLSLTATPLNIAIIFGKVTIYSFCKKLRAAAAKLRIFLKYISDAFNDLFEQLKESQGEFVKGLTRKMPRNILTYVPSNIKKG